MLIGIDARAANEAKKLGTGVYVYELIRAMTGLGQRLRIYLDRPPYPGFPLGRDEADIQILPAGKYWTLRHLSSELRRNPPDVFLAPVTQLPLFCPCPVVATHHGLAYVIQAECFSWTQRMRGNLSTWLMARGADHVLAVSEDMKRDLARVAHLPPERITVTYHGCSPRFRPCTDPDEMERVRKKLELPERYILLPGRLSPRKNTGRLIEAFQAMLAEHPDLPHDLVLAGDRDWSAEAIVAAAQQSPVHERIHLVGHVEHDDMPALTTGADVVVLASLWESFGIPIIEAMACGTPVITSNCYAMPEIAGDAALLVDPYDASAIQEALFRILTDTALRNELRAKGIARAQSFTWENTARQTLAGIEKAIAAK